MKKLIAIMLASMVLVACSSNDEKKSAAEAKAKELYDRAKAASKEAQDDLSKEAQKLRD